MSRETIYSTKCFLFIESIFFIGFASIDKKNTRPNLGRPAENDFAPSQLGNGRRKSGWLKPNLGKLAGKLIG